MPMNNNFFFINFLDALSGENFNFMFVLLHYQLENHLHNHVHGLINHYFGNLHELIVFNVLNFDNLICTIIFYFKLYSNVFLENFFYW